MIFDRDRECAVQEIILVWQAGFPAVQRYRRVNGLVNACNGCKVQVAQVIFKGF